jgi:CO/xanthine dehydrogenase Mo-binding subunit/aerobic-type carbon monoxide dehydrogenase small subunit (CoxS/CutS family)
MADIAMEMGVNGKPVRLTVDTQLRLLDVLRDELHLTGAKEGCGEGECGACSILVNGKLVKSCLMPIAKAQGAEIVTVEGIAQSGQLSTVQRAFVATGASQCGFCMPGMVMAATALLQRNPEADDTEIRRGISGNICRCTGYRKIFEAIALARDTMQGCTLAPPAVAVTSYIGAAVARIDAPSKVTGALKYAADISMPGMLHVAMLRSPHAHARILSIDTSEAEAMPGVEAVLTHRDVPGEDGHGVVIDDQPAFATDRVRFVGEGIAAVVAESSRRAREAIARIKVEYEPLPGVFSAAEALADGAPTLHDAFPGNVLRHVKIRKGDVRSALARADIIVEETYRTQAVEHAYLEPEAGIAYVEADGTLTVVSPSQNITHHRSHLSKMLGLPLNKVRCIMSPVGGGFGGKEDMTVQHVLALAALRTRRPVRYVFTRRESFLASAKRHSFEVRYRTGLMHDGHIVASDCYVLADGGAYAFSSPAVIVKAAILANGPYRIENVRVDAIVVYTNNTPSGAMRGFGATQMHFATEAHMDLCASRLRIDPLEFRRLNALRDGDRTHTQQALPSVSLLRTIEAAANAADRPNPGAPGSGQSEVVPT